MHTRKTLFAMAGALALLPAAGGCSFKLVNRPPSPSEWPQTYQREAQPQKCTSSPLPPVLDTVATLVLLTAAFVERDFPGGWAPIVLTVGAVAPAVSAGYGYGVTWQCRRYLRRFEPPPAP